MLNTIMNRMFAPNYVPFELIRFTLLTSIMIYAAYSDYKTKEVPNKTWLYILIGGALTLVETKLQGFNTDIVFTTVFSIITVLVIGLMFFYTNQWGGADTKAFITIGVSAPLFPVWTILHNIPFPFSSFPFLVLFSSSTIAVIYILIVKSNVPLKQRKIKFLPFMLAGLILMEIL